MKNIVEHDTLTDKDHQRVATFMNEEAGIQLPKNKRNLIETRLRKRQRTLKCRSLSHYIDYALADTNSEQLHFIDALTTNKTEFFREASHYPFYIDYISAQHPSTVRVWSAGCSSGEEPYTLAILAEEHASTPVSIHATDISTSMLQRANRAVYTHDSAAPIPLHLRKKYLLRRKTETADEIKIAPSPRKRVTFEPFNLITGHYASLSPFDIIFCRNVMIYFNAAQRENIVRQFCRCLKPGGLLFIGHSETLNNEKAMFSSIAPTVYRREGGQ